jgi:hypothetical protein
LARQIESIVCYKIIDIQIKVAIPWTLNEANSLQSSNRGFIILFHNEHKAEIQDNVHAALSITGNQGFGMQPY